MESISFEERFHFALYHLKYNNTMTALIYKYLYTFKEAVTQYTIKKLYELFITLSYIPAARFSKIAHQYFDDMFIEYKILCKAKDKANTPELTKEDLDNLKELSQELYDHIKPYNHKLIHYGPPGCEDNEIETS